MQKSTVMTRTPADLNGIVSTLEGGVPKVSIPRTAEGSMKISVEYDAEAFQAGLASKLNVEVETLNGLTFGNKKDGGLTVTLLSSDVEAEA